MATRSSKLILLDPSHPSHFRPVGHPHKDTLSSFAMSTHSFLRLSSSPYTPTATSALSQISASIAGRSSAPRERPDHSPWLCLTCPEEEKDKSITNEHDSPRSGRTSPSATIFEDAYEHLAQSQQVHVQDIAHKNEPLSSAFEDTTSLYTLGEDQYSLASQSLSISQTQKDQERPKPPLRRQSTISFKTPQTQRARRTSSASTLPKEVWPSVYEKTGEMYTSVDGDGDMGVVPETETAQTHWSKGSSLTSNLKSKLSEGWKRASSLRRRSQASRDRK
jgi:hypothetical protein